MARSTVATPAPPGSHSVARRRTSRCSTTAAATTTTAETTPLAKADYVKQMKAIGRSLSTSLNSLGAATTAAKAATALQAVQTDLRHAADRIESLTPPDAIKAQHSQLAKAVRDFADELDTVIAKLKTGNMQALSTVPAQGSARMAIAAVLTIGCTH